MRRESIDYFFIGLLSLGVVCFLAFFTYRELFPEYKIYQDQYQELNAFLAEEQGRAIPPFRKKIHQIVIDSPQGQKVERCVSCHLALKIPDFSPTQISRDSEGKSIEIPNPSYVWTQLEQSIASCEDPKRKKRLEKLQKKATQSTKKALQMHPLFPGESRAFELHPMEEFACSSCHGGNGHALTADKAHGPLYDGEYHSASHGPSPHFLEEDPLNDPAFARLFNHKPGHKLLFQTTPLMPGALIESNCIQCHEPQREKEALRFTHFQKGEELFQRFACYSCHKIDTFSRGTVGPDLSEIGKSYPWYVKESIVWPQGNLASSTMPNFHLDHHEIETIMSFLMGQKGQKSSESEQTYKQAIKEWKKEPMPWERAIPLSSRKNLKLGAQTFAKEGCAACHRIQGFSSGQTSSPEGLKWFRENIPEDIKGSVLIKALETVDIHAFFSPSSPQNPQLDLHNFSPELLSSFYPSFQYALRSRSKASPSEKSAWKAGVHKLLFHYITQYGLGGNIGPRLHWSGIQRSSDWLLEHFQNPQLSTPKSLMPRFPFDESKFEQLIFFLQKMAIQNRKKIRKLWNKEGFSASGAFEQLCASCHGPHAGGNGILVPWMHPVPKNLRNPQFLQHLSRERIADAILHGVQGSPMPPWGESHIDNDPLLGLEEAQQIAQWLLDSLPAGNRDFAQNKWDYAMEELMEELSEEESLSLSPDSLFKIQTQEGRPDTKRYLLKESFFNRENLRAGEELFLENCAQCHGIEADGNGVRASQLHTSKPKVLRNLSWLNMRDDLRLLRSIKFGVPGTSMAAWGDKTTVKQRIQLLTFIRKLSRGQEEQQKLNRSLRAHLSDLMHALKHTIEEEELIQEKLSQEEKTLSLKRLEAEQIFDHKQSNSLYTKGQILREKLLKHEQKLFSLKKEEKKLKTIALAYTAFANPLIAEGLYDTASLLSQKLHDFSPNIPPRQWTEFSRIYRSFLISIKQEILTSLELHRNKKIQRSLDLDAKLSTEETLQAQIENKETLERLEKFPHELNRLIEKQQQILKELQKGL